MLGGRRRAYGYGEEVTSTLTGPRPTPLSRVWSSSQIIADDLQGEDLSDVLEMHADASAWWVMPRQAEPSLQLLDAAHALDLDHLVLKDLTADDQRAKFDDVGAARVVLTNAVVLNPDRVELAVHPVSLVVTDRALICLNDPPEQAFDPAALLSQRVEALAQGGVDMALHVVLSAVIGSYETAVEWLEDASDELADILFEERPLNRSEQLQAFRLRTALSRLRRLTEPMRTVMTELVESLPEDQGLLARHWSMARDRHTRVANAADALRESLSSVFDTSLALADQQTNAIVKKLTGWAAIIAVPTLITGFVGMNVAFPLDGTAAGFWFYLALMVVASLGLYLAFRRRRWI